MSGGAGSEDELIARIRERLRGVPDERLLLGIGDDAAVWQPSRGNRSVITTDALVEGVHFTRDAMSARDAGHRALAANLSDVAAMGARPVLATVALGFPPDTDTAWLLEAYDGIAALAKRARCAVAGGDLTRAPAITFAITVVGEVRASNLKTRAGALPGRRRRGHRPARREPRRPARRGRPAGTRAASRSSRRRWPPTARRSRRLREGRWLAASRNVRAMMDTSDGLSTDLARLCAASGAGATIESGARPRRPPAASRRARATMPRPGRSTAARTSSCW